MFWNVAKLKMGPSRAPDISLKMNDLELIADMHAFHAEKLYDADGCFVGSKRPPVLKFYQMLEESIVPEKCYTSNTWDLYNGGDRIFIAPGVTMWISTNIAVRVPMDYLLWIRAGVIHRIDGWSSNGEVVVARECVIPYSRTATEIKIKIINFGIDGYYLQPFHKLADFHLVYSPDVDTFLVE